MSNTFDGVKTSQHGILQGSSLHMENQTIEDALDLVSKKGAGYADWKRKSLGLRQVLIGLAEVQALRVSKLAGMVVQLEKELLSEEKLRNLDAKQLYGLYRTATESLQVSSQYIQDTLKSTNWKEFETELLAYTASETPDAPHDLREVSDELLTILAQMRGQILHQREE